MTRLTWVMRSFLNRTRSSLQLILIIVIIFAGAGAVAAQDEVTPDNSGRAPQRTHVVQVDETLISISALYNIPPSDIRTVNELGPSDSVYVGQSLTIPLEALEYQQFVDVGFTDTLRAIASRSRLSPERLAAINRIVNPNLLYSGMVLELEPPNAFYSNVRATTTSRVSEQQPIWRLAVQANQPVAALTLFNGIVNPATAAPGRIVTLPAEASVDLLTAPWARIDLEPAVFSQGRTNSLRITTAEPGTVSGTFLDAELRFVQEEDGTWSALLPVSRFQNPGRYPLSLTFTAADGNMTIYSRDVIVNEGNYALEGIFISEDVLEALRDEQAVTEEVIYIRTIMAGFEEQRRWQDGLWLKPAPGIMSSGFGSSRVYNQGDLTSWHPGSDLAAPIGTPIYAPAAGVVVDTANLEVRGLVTILNHGRGVYTGYWHQQNIFVEPGNVVEAGQLIGEIGNTGLSTAPHLHWEMHVNGIPVEPLQWVREIKP